VKFARSKDGAVVHQATCRHARIPWNWADDKPSWAVVGFVERASWLRLCRVCFSDQETHE
jgi:hypothetical protein